MDNMKNNTDLTTSTAPSSLTAGVQTTPSYGNINTTGTLQGPPWYGMVPGVESGGEYYTWVTDDLLGEVHRSFFMFRNPPTAVLIGLYAITCLVGLVGNILVLYVFGRNRHMRTPTNAFLGNLAVCDLMVVCMCMPFTVAFEVYANWIYGDIMCRLVNFVKGLSVTASILTLTVISAERFYAIKRPFKARTFQSKKRIYKIIAAIWVTSAVVVLPVIFVRRGKQMEKILHITISACVEVWPERWIKHLYNFSLLTLLYLGPVVFIVVGYLHIGLNLWRTDSLLHTNNSVTASEGMRATLTGRRRVAKMLFVMALLFAVSWLPFHLISLVLDYLPEHVYTQHGLALRQLYSYLLWLAHANSSVNPVCYCIMSQSFKTATIVELKQCCRRQRRYADFRRRSFVSLTLNSSNSSAYKWTRTYRPSVRQSWTAVTMVPCRSDKPLTNMCAV